MGHCGVQFREMGVWPLRTHWGFDLETLWCSAQADRSLVFSGPTGVSALIHFGVQSRVDGSLVSSGPAGSLDLGLSGVQFRLTEVLSFQDPLGFQLWDFVGFSSARWESGHGGPTGALVLYIVGFSSS